MNSALQSLVSRAVTLHEDLALAAVREWKEKHPGAKAIGHLPIYVPRELIHAAGMLPVGIMGGGEELEIIRGDAYFQSYICHIPRSTIELALSGRLDCLDGMLFPSICDVIRNLSGMWKLLFPKSYVRYVDVPQNFVPGVGGLFWRHELEGLRRDLEELGGRPIDDESLRASIEIYNENRRAIAELYAARSQEPWIYPSYEMYPVVRAGNVLPPDEHTQMVRDYLALARNESGRVEMDLSRVVVVGTFCEQPPVTLLKTLERAGCFIVDDDMLLGLRWLTGDVPLEGDPLQNLVEAYLSHSVSTASRYEPKGDKGRSLLNSVHDNAAEGVILAAPSFCDPALLDQPMLAAALAREGIPYTQFKYSEDMGQFAVIREQTGTFADSIRLWNEREG